MTCGLKTPEFANHDKMEAAKCQISAVFDGGKPTISMILPHGGLVPQEANTFRGRMYRERKTGLRVLATTSTGENIITGRVQGNENNIFWQMLAIRNKKTNKVRLLPMEKYMVSPVTTKMQNEVMDNDDTKEISQGDANQLGLKFGSKRKQRSLEYYSRMRADKEVLEEKLKTISENVNVEVLETPDDSGSTGFLPPANREATNVVDVYTLSNFLSDKELDILKAEAVKVLTNPEKFKDSFSEVFTYVLAEMQRLDTEKILHGVSIMLYVDLLIRFLRCPTKVLYSKTYSACKFSHDIHKKIINDFTVSSATGRTRPITMRDKGICYVIVLGLLANGFQLDLGPLSKSLNAPVKRLHHFCSFLGAFPKTSGSTIVVLKVPMPPINLQKQSRRRRT